MYKHLMIMEFALSSLYRRKYKNLLMLAVYSLVVFLLSSLVLLTDSLKTEAVMLTQESPQLIVQRLKGGRHDLILREYAAKIHEIRGVDRVSPRFWGYYFDPATRSNYTFWGADEMGQDLKWLEQGEFSGNFTGRRKEDQTLPCIIGQGIADLRFIGIDDLIPVMGSDGNLYVLKVSGVFNPNSSILTNDMIVMGIDTIKTLFEIPENMATDIAVYVRNQRETDMIGRKIQQLFPSVRIITKQQIQNTYKALFSWRSGLMAALLLSSIAAFAILTWDKALGATDYEKKEIGVLKAVGWNTAEVLELKFFEGAAISATAFLTGLIFACVHVFYAGGILFEPVLRGWSVLFPKLKPLPVIDIYNLLAIWFLSVVPYMASTIIPFWKTAVTDPEMVMK